MLKLWTIWKFENLLLNLNILEGVLVRNGKFKDYKLLK